MLTSRVKSSIQRVRKKRSNIMLTTEQRILIVRVYCGTNSLKRLKEAFETDFPNTPILAETTIIRLVNNLFATVSVANAPKAGR